MKKSKTIWVLIDHPRHVVNGIGFSLLLSEKVKLKLLISSHPYWKNLDTSFLNQHFVDIFTFPKVNFSHLIPVEMMKIWLVNYKLDLLNVNSNDVLVSFTDNLILEAIFMKKYPGILKYKIWPEDRYNYYMDTASLYSEYKEEPISNFYRKLIFEPLNYQSVLFMKHKNEPRLFRIPFKESAFKLYDKVFYTSENESTEKSSLPSLFPIVRDQITQMSNDNVKNKKILFFGAAYHHINKKHFQLTNRCLRYIEKFIPNAEYYYKPHPHDKVEYKKIELGKFNIYDKPCTTETLLLSSQDFTHFFAVSSSAIVRCVELGRNNSYLFFDLSDLYSKKFRQFLEDQYQLLRKHPQVFIDSFDKPPRQYKVDSSNCKRENYNKYNQELGVF